MKWLLLAALAIGLGGCEEKEDLYLETTLDVKSLIVTNMGTKLYDVKSIKLNGKEDCVLVSAGSFPGNFIFRSQKGDYWDTSPPPFITLHTGEKLVITMTTPCFSVVNITVHTTSGPIFFKLDRPYAG